MNKLVPLLALALLTQAASCRKKDPAPDPPASPLNQLPPETQTGQCTFGCLVNGQAWTPAGSSLGGPLVSCSYMNSRLAVVVSRRGNFDGISTFQRISLVLDKVSQTGSYAANDSLFRVAEYEDLNNGCTLTTTAVQSGSIELTKLDPVARIASGRFFFTLGKAGYGRVVVTDGRFDYPF